MRNFAKKLLCDWPYCAAARPLTAMVAGATTGGVFGLLCGTLWGVLERSMQIPLAMGFRGVVAGGAAGLLIGICDTIDRRNV
jgi:hypothetical protein